MKILYEKIFNITSNNLFKTRKQTSLISQCLSSYLLGGHPNTPHFVSFSLTNDRSNSKSSMGDLEDNSVGEIRRKYM